jgi:hypothetical protein
VTSGSRNRHADGWRNSRKKSRKKSRPRTLVLSRRRIYLAVAGIWLLAVVVVVTLCSQRPPHLH